MGHGIPVALRLACTALLLGWTAVYWRGYGPANFLWFCDLANFLIVIALWAGSPLLLSAQAVSVVIVQTLWSLDVLCRALFGFHPIGATDYVFDPAIPLQLRAASLFHAAVPPLVLWSLRRLGYDRRGWLLQTGIAWVVLPASYLIVPAPGNTNFVRGPSSDAQTLVDPLVYLLLLMLAYPLLLYLPSHLLLRRLLPDARRGGRPPSPR